MKNINISVLSILMGALTGYGEMVAEPAELWTQYDLIAKVNILAVHTNQEVLFFESARGKSYGYLVDAEVTEALRIPPELEKGKIQLIAPVYSIYGDRRLEFDAYSKREFSAGKQRAMACSYQRRTKTWLVADWVLTEEMWGEYRSQKERGVTDDESHRDEGEYALENAGELIRRWRGGEITLEEYNDKMAPIREYYKRKSDELQELP